MAEAGFPPTAAALFSSLPAGSKLTTGYRAETGCDRAGPFDHIETFQDRCSAPRRKLYAGQPVR
ncbi:hypothetical protein [Acetobacter nitrogenifigens]|nr:hypothetical protein [Acetobacter nitrogenifigens]